MGQQASVATAPPEVQEARPWCRENTSSDHVKADKATDSVRIGKHFQARAGLCSGVLPPGPDVLVSDVTRHSARVYWSINQEARKVHLAILANGEDGPEEVGFYEVGGSQSSWDVPQGILSGPGPYQVQLVLESGPEDAPLLTKPSTSEPFWAAEAPSQVKLQLAKVDCEGFVVAWREPDDDGGAPVEAFQVQCQSEEEQSKFTCQVLLPPETRSHGFEGFQPGSGPYKVEVRAVNRAKLWSDASEVEVITAFLPPPAPVQLAARLLPGWASRTLSPLHFEGTTGLLDFDVVKLEFISPIEDAAHPIQSYIIHAEEELSEASLEKPGPKQSSLEVAASAVTADEITRVDGASCCCHVAVEPNRSYIFTVEATTGRSSASSRPSPPVFAPARVPQAPAAPQVLAVDGLAAELRWNTFSCGGGLPIEGFKVGVLDAASPGQAQNLQREVSFSWATVAEVTAGFLEKTEKVSCKARVEGLLPNTRYNFVLAASNSAGTGRWSPISNCLQTASAPPAAPINTVATVSQDAEQQVVVTISWECPPDLPGSGGLAAFDVQMLPAEMQRVRPSSDRRLVRERLAQRGKPGERIRWAKILAAPGCYVVEVASESSEGQKSAPAVLTLEVSPEAFPSTELPVAPKWSSEPYLALGPAAESTTRFGSLEGTWLQMLLLWGDPVGPQSTRTWPSPVDVLCFFRRPGSSQVFRATLASEVTSSRLQVALPAHVPMSLRLVVKMDPKLAAKTPRPPMSEPLAVLLSDDGETLQPNWEIWARNNPDGQPARWTSIPQELQQCIEAAWLEGHPKVALQLPHATEGRMAAGSYELTFGDERQTQSTVKKLGPNGWTAKARRSVLTSEEDSTAATASSDEMCVICMERRRTHAFMHADGGHLAVCVDCAEAYRAEAAVPGGSRAVRNCPMCRQPFERLQRIYQ